MKVVTLKLIDAIRLKDTKDCERREKVIKYIMRKYNLTRKDVLKCVENMCSGRIVVYE